MTEDIVAALDAELALIEQLPYRVPIHTLAQRARDEIVATQAAISRATKEAYALGRAEALEEAAQIFYSEAKEFDRADLCGSKRVTALPLPSAR